MRSCVRTWVTNSVSLIFRCSVWYTTVGTTRSTNSVWATGIWGEGRERGEGVSPRPHVRGCRKERERDGGEGGVMLEIGGGGFGELKRGKREKRGEG